ncbi:hypothetical protein [Paraburkholderia xenovorans]
MLLSQHRRQKAAIVSQVGQVYLGGWVIFTSALTAYFKSGQSYNFRSSGLMKNGRSDEIRIPAVSQRTAKTIYQLRVLFALNTDICIFDDVKLRDWGALLWQSEPYNF